MGKKNRPAINPANVVLWARRIEKENTVEQDSDLSHETQRVILALRQWLKYLPKKERTFKKEYMNSAVSQWMYENKSDYFLSLAQIELWLNSNSYENKVYMLPKHLDEKVAKLHLKRLGVELEELNKEQADYIGVKVEGPYKPEYYRY